MVASIVSTGLAIGCIYALIGITYNVMFSASRVFSFTAGTLGMLGGVLGSLFIARLGLPVAIGFLLALAGDVYKRQEDINAGIQYSRINWPMTVPGPTRVNSTLSLAVVMASSRCLRRLRSFRARRGSDATLFSAVRGGPNE